MAISLVERIGIGDPELISIVGAGGKSTILFMLGRDLAASGSRVILTTTTMMAADQITEPTCWSDGSAIVDAALVPGSPLFVVTGRIPGKVTGPSPETVDSLFAETRADYVIVEADGARSMSIKAPADHEPAIPSASTTVIVVAAVDAIGHPISEVAHRPGLVASLAGVGEDDLLTTKHAATVLLHPDGGMKGVPANARVVMALTKATPATEEPARDLAATLASHPGVNQAIILEARTP